MEMRQHKFNSNKNSSFYMYTQLLLRYNSASPVFFQVRNFAFNINLSQTCVIPHPVEKIKYDQMSREYYKIARNMNSWAFEIYIRHIMYQIDFDESKIIQPVVSKDVCRISVPTHLLDNRLCLSALSKVELY